MILQTNLLTELKMIKHISSYKRTWRIYMICLCHWKEMEQKTIQCLLLRAYSVHHAQKESKIWLDSEQIIRHGTTSHSKNRVWGCRSKDKVSRKCILNPSMKVHIMVVIMLWLRHIQVHKILMIKVLIGNKCLVLAKILNWNKPKWEEIALEVEEWDLWQPKSVKIV